MKDATNGGARPKAARSSFLDRPFMAIKWPLITPSFNCHFMASNGHYLPIKLPLMASNGKVMATDGLLMHNGSISLITRIIVIGRGIRTVTQEIIPLEVYWFPRRLGGTYESVPQRFHKIGAD